MNAGVHQREGSSVLKLGRVGLAGLAGLALFVFGSAIAAGPSPRGESIPPELASDSVLVNGKVVTMDDTNRIAEAVAIKGERIVTVGTNEAIRKLVGARTQVIDVQGRLVLPGWVDAHSHTAGVPADWLDLSGAHSIAEIQEAVARKTATKPLGSWIVGSGSFMTYSGWDDQRLKEKRWLTRWDIDPVSPNHPALLMKEAGHALVINSYALKLAGITKDTPDPKGQIVKDPKTGEPTGALVEAAMELATRLLPPLTREELVGAAARASEQLLHMGTTTVGDASVTEEMFRTFQSLYSDSERPLVTRILDPLVPATKPLEEVRRFVENWSVVTGFGSDELRLGALKIFVDGGVTSRAAWFKKPYKDRPGHYGIPQVDRTTLIEVVKLADRLGWQLHFHACGDAAADLALDALDEAQKENRTSGRRHVLTHLYVLSSEQIARMQRLGVIAVLQPNFVYALGEHMEAALSEDQLTHYMPFRTLLQAGIPVALSADGHPQNPIYGIYAAVVRKTKEGHPLGTAEAVGVLDAVRAYTRSSAHAIFEENRRGSIEPGKFADLIVLDQDIFTVPPEQIKDAQVLLTVKNGQIAVNLLPQANKK